jgi:hypothetical protein
MVGKAKQLKKVDFTRNGEPSLNAFAGTAFRPCLC